jgi:hypothetical protein
MGSCTSQQQIEQIERDEDRELCSWIAQQPRVIERAALLGQHPGGSWPGVGVGVTGAIDTPRGVRGRPPRGCDCWAQPPTCHLEENSLPVRAYDKEVAEEGAARATFAHAANSVKRGAASA